MARATRRIYQTADEATDKKATMSIRVDSAMKNKMIELAEKNARAMSGPKTLGQIVEVAIREYFEDQDRATQYEKEESGGYQVPGE